MKDLKLSLFSILDILKFNNLGKYRDKFISKGKNVDIDCKYSINEKAKALHPNEIELVVVDIKDFVGNLRAVYFKNNKTGKLPYFKAGQYITLIFNIEGNYYSRVYGIMTSPTDAKNGIIGICVKKVNDGFVSKYICDKLQIGEKVFANAPEGRFTYVPLRDSKNVVAIVGSIDITPILSMACAIHDGDEDFNLTILYGAKNISYVFAKSTFDEIIENNSKVKVHYVFEDLEGTEYVDCEQGTINREIIERYSTDGCSYYVTGPDGRIDDMVSILNEMGVKKKKIRLGSDNIPSDLTKEKGYPANINDKKFKLTLKTLTSERELEVDAKTTLLMSMENNGIFAQSKCRYGECGFCRSKVISGEYFVPEKIDHRRYSDKKYNYIHPCVTYPLSDIVLELHTVID